MGALDLGAASDNDDLAGDLAGFGSAQEARDCSDILWLSDATNRDVSRGRQLPVLEVDSLAGRRCLGHLRFDEAWCDRVRRHAELAQLQRKTLGEANQPSFGSGVIDLAPVADFTAPLTIGV